MEAALVKSVGALLFVTGLILAVAWLVRRVQGGALAKRFSAGRRLTVSEQLYLDPKHKLVLVKRDATEHLLLIGPNAERVVESFPAPAAEVTHAAS